MARITPAYAGKRDSSREKYSSMEDHPRLCGEKSPSNKCSWEKSGSPPPMRGKVDSPHIKTTNAGITPAYAGKRSLNLFNTQIK